MKTWQQKLASEFRSRDNIQREPWVHGDVISPVWDDDEEAWVGPLLITCYNGEITLTKDMVYGRTSNLHDGMSVTMVGDIFNGSNRQMLILSSATTGASLAAGDAPVITDLDVIQAELTEVTETAFPHAVVTAERDLDKLGDDGVYVMMWADDETIQNAPENNVLGNYMVVNHMVEYGGNMFGFQFFGRIVSSGVRTDWHYRHRISTGWSHKWIRLYNDLRGLLVGADADLLHSEKGRYYSGGYTLSYSADAENSNFPYNSTLAYVDIECLQYNPVQVNDIVYRPYKQTFIPALPTHSHAGETYTRVLRVITDDCIRNTDGKEFQKGDIYDKSDWKRQITDAEYDALSARLSAIEEALGISEISTLSLTPEEIEEEIAEEADINLE